MNAPDTQAALRAAVALNAQIRQMREQQTQLLRFVGEGLHMLDGQPIEVLRIELKGENHPNQKTPRFTKAVRSISMTKAQRLRDAGRVAR
jgi:hypothetical protein